MYIRKERKKPFTPSASFQSLSKSLLSSASPPTTTTSLTDSISTNGRRESTILKEEIKDAETGESLSFTKAKWTAKEGRLSLNAKVILAMGTGKLDIITSSQHSDRGVKINETHEQERCPTATAHPLIQEFLTKGPLTPYMHKNWDPRRDRVRSSSNTNDDSILDELLSDDDDDDDDENDENNGDDYPSQHRSTHRSLLPLPPPNMSSSSSIPNGETNEATSYTLASSTLKDSTRRSSRRETQGGGLILLDDNDDPWRRLLLKSFQELLTVVEEMEKNKVLTKEEPRPGGKKAVRTLCWQLAKLKVKQRQELAKALEDEQDRESKRLQAERENWDNANVLRELRKANRAARKKGQIYLEHLQRDQEVIFMRKMKDFELLW